MNNKVSIIMPSFNSEKYVLDAIISVQNQTYKNWEMIIVDDCSNDNTINIISEVIANDNRIKLYRQERNLGAGAARTRALGLINGRFIAYLDADDIWYPDKLSKQISFMLKNNIGFSCTSYEVIDNDGNKLNKQIYMLPKVDYIGF